jgi:hypothetical protein
MQIVLVAAMVSATGGYLGDVDRTTWASDLARAAENAVTDLSRAELVLFPLLLVGVAATRMVAVSDRASVDQETAVTGRRTLTCLMFAIAVTPPATSVVSLVAWPGWLLTWWILARLTKRTPSLPPADTDPGTLLDQAVVHTAARRAPDESDATPADHSEASAQRERRQALQNAPAGDAAVHFLARGPYANWAENAQTGARIAWWAGLAPLAYFAWTALALAPQNTALSTISLNVVMALLREVIFWVSAGFAFAGLYPLLPGRIGPTKALALWSAWIASTLIAELVSAWPDPGASSEWVYRLLQLLLVLLTVAVAYDLQTIHAVNVGWRRILDLYNVHRYRDLAAYLIPVALAIAGLIQQIAAGTGADVVEATLKGIAQILNPPSHTRPGG